jgi:hypothetical protein
MTLPGFTAEISLRNPGKQYRTAGVRTRSITATGVLPQACWLYCNDVGCYWVCKPGGHALE